jgi:uncharacterized protein YaaW (UPF0174 family)
MFRNLKLQRDGTTYEWSFEVDKSKHSHTIECKDVLNTIKTEEENQKKFEDQLVKINMERNNIELNRANSEKVIETFKKESDWCEKVCNSKIKQIYAEHRQEIIDAVKKETVKDTLMTDDVFIAQKLNSFRYRVHTHPEIAKHIPDYVIKEALYGKNPSLLTNNEIDEVKKLL